jgi:predicted ArsR family transcriptional regulator
VTAAAEPRSVPGRPRLLYRLGSSALPSHGDEYRLLASVLADTLSRDPAGTDACEESGRAWGAGLVAGRRAPAAAVDAVVEILDAQGFEPQAREQAIEMHRCPFHDLAEANPRVVCAVHRGLIDGALAELGSGLSVSALEIFPRPNVCVARLAGRRGPRKEAAT